jgi:hypothetical protein
MAQAASKPSGRPVRIAGCCCSSDCGPCAHCAATGVRHSESQASWSGCRAARSSHEPSRFRVSQHGIQHDPSHIRVGLVALASVDCYPSHRPPAGHGGCSFRFDAMVRRLRGASLPGTVSHGRINAYDPGVPHPTWIALFTAARAGLTGIRVARPLQIYVDLNYSVCTNAFHLTLNLKPYIHHINVCERVYSKYCYYVEYMHYTN